jgi:hypothetical protein
LPTEVGRRTIPYGLMSPFAGTVEATVETVFSGAMNAAVVVGVLVVCVVAAGALVAVGLDVLLLLLELPHPASASAARGAAKIIFLLTGLVLSLGSRGHTELGVDLKAGCVRPLVTKTPKPARSFPACP